MLCKLTASIFRYTSASTITFYIHPTIITFTTRFPILQTFSHPSLIHFQSCSPLACHCILVFFIFFYFFLFFFAFPLVFLIFFSFANTIVVLSPLFCSLLFVMETCPFSFKNNYGHLISTIDSVRTGQCVP